MTNATTSQSVLLKQLKNFTAGCLLWLGSVCIKLAKALLAD
jgi:hypothetical protein